MYLIQAQPLNYMSKRRFTAGQINDLLNNKNVIRCSEKSITYSPGFKVAAVKRYREEGAGSKQIFEEAGFDLGVIGRDSPKDCLKCWTKIFKRRGMEALSVERRGKSVGVGKGRPRIRGLTDTQKIKRLELTVAYLKAENDFLAKLRAKRTE